MKKIRNLLVLSCVLLGLSGCSDWLTIQPETQITEEDMFKTQGGFYDALTGYYVLMRNNYSPDGAWGHGIHGQFVVHECTKRYVLRVCNT